MYVLCLSIFWNCAGDALFSPAMAGRVHRMHKNRKYETCFWILVFLGMVRILDIIAHFFHQICNSLRIPPFIVIPSKHFH